jgi:hypothetical protein
MGASRAIAVLILIALCGGCFGYNRSAKRWSYVGNTVLILGGGGAIAAGILDKEPPTQVMTGGKPYDPPFNGALVAGVVLATAGLVGIVFNATRPNVKTSR